jgi:hypothetical protein
VPQNLLNGFIWNPETVQIGCEPTPKSMPAMPNDAAVLQSRLHFPLIHAVEVKRIPETVDEHRATNRIMPSSLNLPTKLPNVVTASGLALFCRAAFTSSATCF